jgi:acetyl-CoA acetyltransferase
MYCCYVCADTLPELCNACLDLAAACCLLSAQDGGAVTAGNSSPITDGACALVLVSAAKAAELGCPVLAVLRGYGDANQDPEWFTTAPAAVTPKVC